MGGGGRGTVAFSPGGAAPLAGGLAMALAAAGTRGALREGGADGWDLDVQIDTFWVRTRFDGADTAAGRLAVASGTATRKRAAVDTSPSFCVGAGLALRPSVEIGLRHDGGDAVAVAGRAVACAWSFACALSFSTRPRGSPSAACR